MKPDEMNFEQLGPGLHTEGAQEGWIAGEGAVSSPSAQHSFEAAAARRGWR
jgi:hypothetical protein